MGNMADIIFGLKEKCEYYMSEVEKLQELYANESRLRIAALKEISELYLMLGEIKINHPETVEIINTRLGEMKK